MDVLNIAISSTVFLREKCGFNLDMKCALLPTVESEGANLIQHFSHPHPLALLENLYGKQSNGNCNACEKSCWLLGGLSFWGCQCDFFLHKTCAFVIHKTSSELEMVISHPLDRYCHFLILSEYWHGHAYNDHRLSHPCSLRRKPIADFMEGYRCEDCDINLHTYCATFEPSRPWTKLTPSHSL